MYSIYGPTTHAWCTVHHQLDEPNGTGTGPYNGITVNFLEEEAMNSCNASQVELLVGQLDYPQLLLDQIGIDWLDDPPPNYWLALD